MPQYVNELSTAFTGRVDGSFDKAVQNVANSLSRLRGEANSLSRTNRTLTDTNRAFKEGTTAGRQYSNAVNGVNGALQNLVRYAVAGTAIAAVTTSFKSGVDAIISYDQSLRNLQAISNESRISVLALGDEIIRVSNNTKFSADEIGNAAVTLAQAGFSIEETQQTIAAVAQLATGTLSSLASVADLTTTAIRAYGLSAAEATRVTDTLAAAVNSSKLNIEALRTAFNFVGATAAQTGVTIEQTAAVMGVLANNGLRASTIGTGLRKVLARLQAPTKKFRDAIANVGISLDDINPNVIGFEKALLNLSKILTDSETGTIDTSRAFELFGLRGAQSAVIIADAFASGEFQNALANIYEVGAAQRQAETQALGLEVQLKNLQDRWKNVAIALGEAGVTGALRAAIGLFSELGLLLQEGISTPLGNTATQITLVTVGILALAPAVTALTSAMGALSAVLATINPAFAAFAVVAGTLIGTYNSLITQQERINQSLEKAAQEAKGLATEYRDIAESAQTLADRQSRLQTTSAEVSAFTQRLIEQYPQLAREISAAGDNVERLSELFDELANQQQQRQIDALTNRLTNITRELDNASVAAATAFAGESFFGLDTENTEESIKRTNTLVAQQSGLSIQLARNLGDAVGRGTLKYNDALEKLIQTIGGSDGAVDALDAFDRAAVKTRNNLSGITSTSEEVDTVLSGLPNRFKILRDSIVSGTNPENIIRFNKLVEDAKERVDALTQLTPAQREVGIANIFNKLEQDIKNLGSETEKTTNKITKSFAAQRKAALDVLRTEEQRIKLSKEARDTGVFDVQRLIELNRQRYETELEFIAKTEAAKVKAGNAATVRAEAEAQRESVREQFQQRELQLIQQLDEVERKRLENQQALLQAQIESAISLGDLTQVNDLKLRELEIEQQLARTQAERLNVQRKITEEQNRQSGTFLDGIISKYRELNATQTTVYELGKTGAENLTDSISTGLAGALASGEANLKNFGQVFGNVIDQAIQDLIKLIIRQLIYNAIVGAVTSAIGGTTTAVQPTLPPNSTAIPSFHGGGRVGDTTGSTRNAHASLFANAPKYHNGGVVGLRSDEQAAILKKGEVVETERDARTRDSSVESVSVNITNESGQQLQVSEASSIRQNKEMIIDIVIEGIGRNTRGLRNAVGGASRGV